VVFLGFAQTDIRQRSGHCVIEQKGRQVLCLHALGRVYCECYEQENPFRFDGRKEGLNARGHCVICTYTLFPEMDGPSIEGWVEWSCLNMI